MTTEIRRSVPQVDTEPDELDLMRADLVKQISTLERRIANMKKIKQNIDELLGVRPDEPKAEDAKSIPPVVKNQYAGMKTRYALEPYMKARQGMKIPSEKILEDLAFGGAIMGGSKKKLHMRNLRIAVGNRKKVYEHDKQWNIWLAPTAFEPEPTRLQGKNRKGGRRAEE